MTIDALKMLPDAQTATTQDATPPPVVEPITLQQAKDHLRVVVPDEDAYISSLITAARMMAEGRLNRTIVQRPRVARFAGWGWGSAMPLLKPPVLSVDNLGYVDDTGVETLLDAGRYYLAPVDDEQTPYLALRIGESFPMLDRRRDAVRVYYTAGYPVGQVPAPICQWILLVVGTLYANRESVVNGVTTFSLPDGFMQMLIQQYMVYE